MRLVLLAVFGVGIGVAQEAKPSCGVVNTALRPDDAFQFTMSFFDSLEEARFAYRPSSDLPPGADPMLQLSDLLFRIKASSLKYDCAAELLRGYQRSKTVPISLAAAYTIL